MRPGPTLAPIAMELPDIRAGAILADPPIPFAAWSRKGEGRSPQHHYSCLAFEQLAAIPVASVAAPDCFLFLCIPLRSIAVVVPLMKAWGFNYSGSAFAWAKRNKSGVGWFMGCGNVCFFGESRHWKFALPCPLLTKADGPSFQKNPSSERRHFARGFSAARSPQKSNRSARRS